MAENISFGQIVKERRNLLGLTQAELARRAGCAPITIRKIEGNTLRPSVQLAELLAHALNVPEKEQAGFVRLARQEQAPSPIPTPSPAPDEIGQPDLSGRSVKGFELGERIGSGGFGVVYRAIQPSVKRNVAVKIILPRFANHPTFIRRFEAEAQLVARLEHPHIVPLYDYWREPDAAYLIMRLLRGGNLETPLHAGPLPLGDAYRLLAQIGLALHAAHKQGIVHRDVKPANILLDEEQNAYLADFGIAKHLELNRDMTAGNEEVYIGSPAYVSPEQIKSEPVRPSSDIYCFGLLLYEMLSGQKPFQGPTPIAYFQQHLQEPVPLLQDIAPGLPPALDTIVQRATAKQPKARYQDLAILLYDLNQALQSATSAGLSSSVNDPHPGAQSETAVVFLSTQELSLLDNPFRGLRPFNEANATNFFGRDTLVQELLGMLSDGSDLARFLAVVGPSGSGKSSVVKAGLMPALRRGGLPGSDDWFIADMTPGSNPFEEVATALKRVAVQPINDILSLLQADQRGLLRAIRRLLPDDGTTELLLVIDQFEELFTLVVDETLRVQFLNSLVTAVLDPSSRLRVVITLRADFTDRPLQYVDFGEFMQQRTAFVLPMTPDELTQAITQPVFNLNLDIKPELIAHIIQDVGSQPGRLPLLQYALTELFEQRNGRILTLTAYQNTGGVTGALASRADELYASLDDVGQQITRQLFLRLITLGEGIEDTRRRAMLSELEALEFGEQNSPMANHQLTMANRQLSIVTEYGRYRLLTFDHDPLTREPTVEVAHEALLREWPRLRNWLEQSRDDVRLQRLLATAVAEWTIANQDDGFLLRGTRLDLFANWADALDLALTHEEQIFIESSLIVRNERAFAEEARRQHELETAQKLATTEKQRAEEQTQAAGQLRRQAILLSGALVGAAILALAALFFANQSNQNAATAVTNANLAATNEAQAITNADLAATRENEASVNAQLAAANEMRAIANEQLALTQQAEAETQRTLAEQGQKVAAEQARLATSRELAAASLINLEKDPELSSLLAIQALETAHTIEAEQALHQAVQRSRVRQTLPQHDDFIPAWIATNPAGDRLFVSGLNGGVMWHPGTEELLFTLPTAVTTSAAPDKVTESWINRSVFSPDGSLLIVANEAWAGDEPLPGLISIIDANSAEELLSFVAHDTGIQVVAINPVGTALASGSVFGEVKVWDLPATLAAGTGQEVAVMNHDGWVYSIDFNSDGSRLASTSGQDETLRVWDAQTGETTYVKQVDASDAIFSRDGAYLIVAIDNEELLVLDAASGEPISAVPIINQNIINLRSGPAGTHLATTSTDGKARIWEFSDGIIGDTPLVLSGHTDQVVGVSFLSDGNSLVTGSTDGTVRVWDISVDGGGEFGRFAHLPNTYLAAFGPDGSWIASAGFDGSVKIVDTATRKERFTVSGHEGAVLGIAVHPAGTRIATAGNDGTVRVWDTQTGDEILVIAAHEITPVRFTRGAKGVAFSPDGLRLASSGADGFIRVWDAESGEELFERNAHEGIANVITYTPDGRWLISAGEDQTLKAWNPVDGQELWRLTGEPNAIWEATFNRDGSRLLVSHLNGTSEVWDFPDLEADEGAMPEITLQFKHNPQFLFKGDFSPDGTRLAIAGEGQTSLHDAITGELLVDLNHGSDMVSFSPDGRILASADSDGYVRLFAVEREDLLALARSRVTRSLTTGECQQYLHLKSCPE